MLGARIRVSLPPGAVLAGIVLVGLVFRVWGLFWGLYDANVSVRPHPDEWVVYWLFQWFGRTHTLDPCPHAPAQCFFDWGPVYPDLAYPFHAVSGLLVAHLPASLLGPHADRGFASAVLAGRITSAIASTLTVLVVYRLARLAFGVGAGLVAAAILSLSALPIQLAHFATPDATSSFLVALTLLALYEAVLRPGPLRFAAAGALVGAAASTEYNLGLLLLPLLAACFLARGPTRTWLVAGLAASAATVALLNLYAFVHPVPFLQAMQHAVRIRTVDSAAQYQNRFAPYGPDWLFVIRFPLGYGVGAGFTAIMLAGLAWSIWRRHQLDLLLLTWTLPYLVVVSVSSAKFMRYSAPLILPLAILAGRLAVEVVRTRRRRLDLLGGAALAGAVLYTSPYDAAYAGLFTAPDPRLVAANWVQRHAVPGAAVDFEQLPNGLINLPYFVTQAGYRPCFSQFNAQRLAGPMRYILLDDYALEEHPRFSGASVKDFRSVLSADTDYRKVDEVDYVPQILGLTFPIGGSPHDWRYPAHRITIYARVSAQDPPAPFCYPTLAAAQKALYPSKTSSGGSLVAEP